MRRSWSNEKCRKGGAGGMCQRNISPNVFGLNVTKSEHRVRVLQPNPGGVRIRLDDVTGSLSSLQLSFGDNC